MNISYGSTQLSVNLNVGDLYPVAAPTVKVIAFSVDDALNPCVIYEGFVANQPPGPAADNPADAAKQVPLTRLDALAFLTQFCP